jgi:hypothetical protein
MQEWITLRGQSSITTVNQTEANWMDVSAFPDIVAWLEVHEVSSGGGGSVQLTYQTAPSKDAALFVPAAGAIVVANGTTITSMLKASAVTPMSRWLRWQLSVTGTPTSAWDAVFRIFISAMAAPGCRQIPVPTSMPATAVQTIALGQTYAGVAPLAGGTTAPCSCSGSPAAPPSPTVAASTPSMPLQQTEFHRVPAQSGVVQNLVLQPPVIPR